ncbi:MAG: chemotaxis protein [Geobacteraceae bacterium]
MKLLIRDYLASLREREELDAILPDLLSELGFTVYSRPRRGTLQRGVDIAAVGEDDDGERKVFLFTVKQGDLTRPDWDSTPQALRPSLNEIRDVYIRNRIPARYKNLNVVICLTFGGDVHEQVREPLTGYIAENTTDRITFDEWNGDKIAGLILKGILREEILPKPMRSHFQKAVAMVDEPDVSYEHFSRLSRDLRKDGMTSAKARIRASRQLNICLWILFVWARDVGNLESPYRASELALLSVWELMRPTIGKKNRENKSLTLVVHQVIELHLRIASEFLEQKVMPYVQVYHGVSMSVGSRSSLDVNLALFEVLGRLGLSGLWIHWLGAKGDQTFRETSRDGVLQFVQAGLALIKNNPALLLPISDRQGTDIALFLQLWLASGLDADGVTSWLREMANRLDFAIHTRGRYPTISSDYRDLSEHPRDRSDDYFKEATSGSTLIPLVAAWLQALGQVGEVEKLRELVRKELEHCTLQLWMPDAASEDKFFVGDSNHGLALCDLPLGEGGPQLLATISEACRMDTIFESLSPIKTGFWPVVLVACRHYNLPIPPGFWIESLSPTRDFPAGQEHA